MKPHLIVSTAALCMGLCHAPFASAQTYLPIDLGVAVSQYDAAINSFGQVVGTAAPGNGLMPVIADADGSIHTIDVNDRFIGYYATSINDAGQVAGYTGHGFAENAFVSGPQGQAVSPLAFIAANDVNNRGQVVGVGQVENDNWDHAFMTGPGGNGVFQIQVPGLSSQATALNDRGQVVGTFTSFTDDFYEHAFLTGPDGAGVIDLGTLGGQASHASDVNASGQVVGNSVNTEGLFRAFITGRDGVGMVDLGALEEHAMSDAHGINASGQVVGYSMGPDQPISRAFVTGANGLGLIDLNTLVSLPQEVTLSDARAINDVGQIVALGTDRHFYLLSPVPEPGTYSLMLLGLAGVVFVARKKLKAPTA